MDHSLLTEVNEFLVMIFNEILVIEEGALSQSEFSDLSIKEMHTIEAVGLSGTLSSNKVAKKLRVTPGTLSVSVQNLVKKDYVQRVKLEKDRRVVRLQLTQKGKLLYRMHHKFHMNMVEETLTGFDSEEAKILLKGLRNLNRFLVQMKESLEKKDD